MIYPYDGIEPTLGARVNLFDNTSVIGKVTLGNRVNVWFGAVLRGDVNTITIGDDTNIQDNATVHVSADFPTLVGKGVTIGHNCIVHACTIGDDCLIGMGSTILDGAVIGEGSIVGANSLVTMNKVFPKHSMIMGAPAKAVRSLTTEEMEKVKKSAQQYVELAESYK